LLSEVYRYRSTPTRGATMQPLTDYSCLKVSIHAPTRGATRQRFNNLRDSRVSIHAPTRGATR